MELSKYTCLYVVKENPLKDESLAGLERYKIGVCFDGSRVGRRLGLLQVGNPRLLYFHRIFFVKAAWKLEQALHQRFTWKNRHIHGEWFQLTLKNLQWIDTQVRKAKGKVIWED